MRDRKVADVEDQIEKDLRSSKNKSKEMKNDFDKEYASHRVFRNLKNSSHKISKLFRY